MSLFRVFFTCLWAGTLSLYLVFLEAEKIRMEHEIHRLLEHKQQLLRLKREEVYNLWHNFQSQLAEGGISQRLVVFGEEQISP